MPTLVIKNPDGTEQEQDFADELVVGRAEGNDLILAEGGVSRKHARFFLEGTDVMVEDLGSANGTAPPTSYALWDTESRVGTLDA